MAFAAAERHQVTPKSGHPVQQQLAAEEADHSQVTTGGSGESTNNDTVMGDKDRWYHGNLSRVECEAVLKKNGFTEGLFVVRESQSASGDFVLSVVHAGEVIHYQIRRRGEDAIFSLSEEQKVIHGLDELIFYYQHQPVRIWIGYSFIGYECTVDYLDSWLLIIKRVKLEAAKTAKKKSNFKQKRSNF